MYKQLRTLSNPSTLASSRTVAILPLPPPSKVVAESHEEEITDDSRRKEEDREEGHDWDTTERGSRIDPTLIDLGCVGRDNRRSGWRGSSEASGDWVRLGLNLCHDHVGSALAEAEAAFRGARLEGNHFRPATWPRADVPDAYLEGI